VLSGPEGYTLLSNGKRVREAVEEGRVTASFEQAEPMPAYLLTAVCAELEVIAHAHNDLAVRYLFPAGRADDALRAMGRTPKMIALFERTVGVPFPWARYDQVVVEEFVFGGMENVGCTTMTDLLLVDEAASVEWNAERLVAHELAHQWFGDLVTCSDWSQGWLNESWATFMEVVWTEHTRDTAEALWFRFGQLRAYFSEVSERYARPIVDYHFREPIDVFDRHLYEKGACVLAMLRSELGEAGFWAGVQHYLSDRAHGSVHTRDLQRALEDATGRNLDGFFAQWVHQAGHPAVAVSLSTSDGLLMVDVTQRPVGASEGLWAFPLTLDIVMVGEDQHVVLPVKDAHRTFVVAVEGEVQAVRVDPGLHLLGALTVSAPREWLIALSQDEDPTVAARALAALVEDGAPAAVQAVRGALEHHPVAVVRGEAATLVGQLGTSEDVALLGLRALEDADPRVRRACCDGLGKVRTTASADALLQVIHGPYVTPHLLASALRALGKTRDDRAVAAARPHLASEGWASWVAAGAIASLASTQRGDVLDDLLAMAEECQTTRVRCAAVVALGDLGAAVPGVATVARERVEQVLLEGGFRTSLAAAASLVTLGDRRCLVSLARVHQSAADGRVKRAAYEAMARLRRMGTDADVGAALRQDVERLSAENRRLQGRIERLERTATRD